MTGSDENIFKTYNNAAKALVGGLTKARAMELSRHQPQGTISSASIKNLFESLACDGWKGQTGTNWVWHDRVEMPSVKNSSDEVLLERAVAVRDVKKWTYQMSTSSGLQIIQGRTRRVNLNSRRAIDLVRCLRARHYAFVELKVGSDNPLFAAFEILGYALAYLHARANGWTGTREPDVFDAEHVELTILGHKDWYEYGKGGPNKRVEFKLDWLAKEIETSLNAFVMDEFKGKPTFSMVFRQYSGENTDQRAKEIHHLAEHDWWKH